MPTPSAPADCVDRVARHGIAVVGELGDERPGQLAALLERAAERACRAAARPRSDASRTSAEPEAMTSRQPRFGQLPWHGGPSMSMTMCPSSAPAPIQPR